MNPVIAVDIGNTNTDIGMIDTRLMKCADRLTVASGSSDKTIATAILTIIKKSTAPSGLICLSSVDKARLKALVAAIKKTTGLACSVVHLHKNLPIKINYQNPSVLGADRIADALYASKKYPGKDVIVIDSGTTITVDIIDRTGTFKGGAIIPGILTQLHSMHTGTVALPQINTLENKSVLPGTSTRECMVAGVKTGLAGAMNALVAAYQKQYKNRAIVLACGGGWSCHTDGIDFKFKFVPDLTLVGTALYGCCCGCDTV